MLEEENEGFLEEAQDGRQQQGGAAAAVRLDTGAEEAPQGEDGGRGGGSVVGSIGRQGSLSNKVFTS